MLWFYLVLAATFLWAIVNLMDKYALSKLNVKSVMIIYMASTLVCILIPAFFPISFSYLAVLAGIFWFVSYYLYFRGLMESEVSKAIILLLTVPIFVAVLSAFLLGEILSILQYTGIVISVIGASFLSFKGFSFHRGALFMLFSSFLFALSDIAAKAALSYIDTVSLFFWNHITGIPVALALLFLWRSQIRFSPIQAVYIVLIAGILSLIGDYLFILSFSLEFVSLVAAIESIQPFFVLVLAVLITRLKPNLLKEDISKKSLLVKILSLLLLVIGVFLVIS